MGKRIISQARGKGSLSYRVRKQAFVYRVGYPPMLGQARVVSLLHSAAHSAPLLQIHIGNSKFYNVALQAPLKDKMSCLEMKLKRAILLH